MLNSVSVCIVLGSKDPMFLFASDCTTNTDNASSRH